MEQPLSDVQEYIQFGTPPGATEDCDFLQQLVLRDGMPAAKLLDVACGVGRHALEMARRGFSITGIDLSADRITYAQSEADRRGIKNCGFIVTDLRNFRAKPEFHYAYSFFNTFSIFIDNDDLIGILKNIRSGLVNDGKFVIQLGTLWAVIAEGNFKNNSYELSETRGNLTRRCRGTVRIARHNNIYQHSRTIQYTLDGKEYPPQETAVTQKIFSVSEWELLCKIAGFVIQRIFTHMDISSEVKDGNNYEAVRGDHDMILVLKKQ